MQVASPQFFCRASNFKFTVFITYNQSMEFSDILLRLGYYVIAGLLPSIIIIPLVLVTLKVEVGDIPPRRLFLLIFIVGVIVSELIPNQPFYLH